MSNVIYTELGFPVVLVDPPMVRVRGEDMPDVNLRDLQKAVLHQLIIKPARLSGEEVRFIRKYNRLTQAALAEVLNMANHSAVSQWESHESEASGMEYNTEVLLRVWMALRQGEGDHVAELLEKLKNLAPKADRPLHVPASRAA